MRSRGQTVTSCTTAPRPAGPGRLDPGECLCSNGIEINSSTDIKMPFRTKPCKGMWLTEQRSCYGLR